MPARSTCGPSPTAFCKAIAGEIVSDVEMGEITWSNELTAHVIELKTTGPARSLAPLPALFQESVRRINSILESEGCRLLPSAMHPWMDPNREMVIWPHDYSIVYEAFNRIFDCRGHGWANLQAVHLNLPFADDAEFARLHAAIRVLLPILPALAASSPIFEGRLSGVLDTRLDVYRNNCRKIPLAAGRVIPEPVFSAADYHGRILEPLWAQIAPHDPEEILQEEWLNSRGAIARFERNTIEIRVLDVQECPQADVAVCALVADVLERLANGHWGDPKLLEAWDTDPLAEMLLSTIRDAEQAVIRDPDYLRLFGIDRPRSAHGRRSLAAPGSRGRAVGPLGRPEREAGRRHDPRTRPPLAANPGGRRPRPMSRADGPRLSRTGRLPGGRQDVRRP